MSFMRWLTSVLFSCIFLSSFLILPASAVDGDNYYSLSPVSSVEPSSAIEWPVSPSVSHDGFLAQDSENLARIMTDLTTTGLTTLKSYVLDIRDSLSRNGTIFGFLSDITDALTAQNVRGSLVWYIKDIDNLLSSLNASLGDGLASESTLSAISDKVATESSLSVLSNLFGPLANIELYKDGNWDVIGNVSLKRFLSSLYVNSSLYAINDWLQPTLYSLVYDLKSVLASDDDKQLAENYKDNRVQAEQDFLNGSSGKTSLGKNDFSSLSSVGGTFKDISSLNGQASLDSFSSGLTDADTTGQGWFSQSTKDALDSVTDSTSSTSSVSTFSDDGFSSVDVDPDPYNMGNFEDHYSWLWGEK